MRLLSSAHKYAFADKTAASGLRSRIKMVPEVVEYGLKGGKKRWTALLGDTPVGHITVDRGHVSEALIHPKYQGMGLGKKMYGDVMRAQPKQSLESDKWVTDKARNVWQSMAKRPGYKVEIPAIPTDTLEGTLRGHRGNVVYNVAEGPQFRGTLPTEAATSVKAPFNPGAAASLAGQGLSTAGMVGGGAYLAHDAWKHRGEKAAFAANIFSGPMNPRIESGASILPPPKRTSLQSVAQKTAGPAWRGVGQGALLGAGIFGGLGALSGSVAKADPDSKRFSKRHPALSGALRSGAVGGLLGGGVNAASIAERYPGVLTRELSQATRPLIGRAQAVGTSARNAVGELRPLKPEVQDALARALALLNKTAAGAPTRGGFLMSSDIPAFKAPSLYRMAQKESDAEVLPEDDQRTRVRGGSEKLAHVPSRNVSEGLRVLLGMAAPAGHELPALGAYEQYRRPTPEKREKDADMLPEGVTYGPGDFKRSKYAMSTQDLGTFVQELREKEADISPAVTWSGAVGGSQRQESDIPPFRAPRLDRVIQKAAAVMSPAGQLAKTQRVGAPKATAPAGPSIADQVKPKGPKFGTGIAGAFKGTIGGTAGTGFS